MAKRDRTAWDADTEAAEPVAASPKRTVDEHRIALGMKAIKHACARQLHGWHEHEHHEGRPMRLTEAAYREAIAAAWASECVPTPNALSPHKGKGR